GGHWWTSGDGYGWKYGYGGTGGYGRVQGGSGWNGGARYGDGSYSMQGSGNCAGGSAGTTGGASSAQLLSPSAAITNYINKFGSSASSMTALVTNRAAIYSDANIATNRTNYTNLVNAYNGLTGVQKMIRDVLIEPAYATGTARNTVTDFMIDVNAAYDVVTYDAPHLQVLHQTMLTAMGYSNTSDWKHMPDSYTIPSLVTDQEYATYSSLYSTISTYLGYVKNDVDNASSGSQTGTQGQREYYYLVSEYGLRQWSYYETVLLRIQEQLDRQKVRQVKARDAALIDEIDQYALTVTNDQPHYFSGDSSTALTNTRAQSVMGTLRGDYESLTNGTFLSYIVAEVMAETSPTRAMTTAEIGIHADRLKDELAVRNYEPRAATWIAWYTAQNNVNLATQSDASIESMIVNAKNQRNSAWAGYVDLRDNYTNSGEAAYGTAQANEVFYDDINSRSTDADFEALIDKEFAELFSRLRPEVNRVYEIYAQYNSVDSRNFAWLIYEIPTLKNNYTSLYNFLVATTYGSNGLNRMNNASYGVNGAKSVKAEWDMMASLLQQAQAVRDSRRDPTRLNKEITDTNYYTVREGDSELDLARETGEDYYVTNTRVSSSIAQIDNFLTGGDFANKLLDLTKEDGTAYTNTSGQPVANLSELIDAVMRDKLYSDKIINMIVGLLYPNVTSTVMYQIYKNLFGPDGKLAGGSMYLGDFSVSKDILFTTAKAGIDGLRIYAFLNGKSYDGHASAKLPDLLKSAGLYIYPATLAEKISSTFPAKGQLQSAANWTGNSGDIYSGYLGGITGDWCHTNMSTGEIDAYNPGIFATTATDEYDVGDCTLVWNINGSKDRFQTALGNIFDSLLPVLQLALGGKPNYQASLSNVLVARADGEAWGKYGVSVSANLDGSAAYNVNATATITAKQNGATLNGYNNILAPLFEALGVTDYSGGNNVSLSNPGSNGSGASYAASIINPIQALINQMSNSPVDKILSILPNIAYFLSYGMIEPLLSGIVLDVNLNITNIDIDLDLSSGWQALVNVIEVFWDIEDFIAGKLRDAVNGFLSDPIQLNLSGFINLAELLDCNDITNVNSILKSVLAKADNPNLQALVDSLPFIDVGQLMSMGSFTKSA
ncbi:MAG: hypothetical protein IJU94_05320, partial [Clostridia bacterium]|nr:hypothetical protein [Clostridia bacterium]